MTPANAVLTRRPSADGLKCPRRAGNPTAEHHGHAQRRPGFHGPLLPRRHRQKYLRLEGAELSLLGAGERSAQQGGGAAVKNRQGPDRDALELRDDLPAAPTP